MDDKTIDALVSRVACARLALGNFESKVKGGGVRGQALEDDTYWIKSTFWLLLADTEELREQVNCGAMPCTYQMRFLCDSAKALRRGMKRAGLYNGR